MWEDAEKGLFRDNRRIRSALKFNNVTEVKSKNIDKTQADKFLEFLTIDTVNNEQNITIKLIHHCSRDIFILSIHFCGCFIFQLVSTVSCHYQGNMCDSNGLTDFGYKHICVDVLGIFESLCPKVILGYTKYSKIF